MTRRELTNLDRSIYESLASHPLQSWAWGEFRQKTGIEVVRLGEFDNNKLKRAYQITLHPLPISNLKIGYFPKGPRPDQQMLDSLKEIGRKYNCIFIQLEPNVIKTSDIKLPDRLKPATHPLFTKHTFHLDLTQSEEALLKNMSSKTRYNIRVAQKHGVAVQEENTTEAFAKYLELTTETTKRQGFYAHSESYHRRMWETLEPAGIAHLLTARYQNEILVTWIVFLYKDVLYYPYGASSSKHKEVMASNLMMWEAIRWGKKQGAKLFDLWGTPGPNPQPTDPYYGFHRFKLGFSPRLVEFVGSYDLLVNQSLYKLYILADKLRWTLLRFKSNV